MFQYSIIIKLHSLFFIKIILKQNGSVGKCCKDVYIGGVAAVKFILFDVSLSKSSSFVHCYCWLYFLCVFPKMPPRKRKAAPEPEPVVSDLEPSKMKVAELKEELTKRGLDTSGKKADLVARLEKDLEEPDCND